MIRILSRPYTDYEKQVIVDLFSEIDVMFSEVYCDYSKSESPNCTTCPVRHLCYDLHKVNEFLEELNK